MAHFRAIAQGNGTEISRVGTRGSGIRTKANGWHFGVYVIGFNEKGVDKFSIHLTEGSSAGKSAKHLGTFSEKDMDKKITVTIEE